MACPEFEISVHEYAAGQLPSSQRGAVEVHLAGCPECRELVRQLQHLDAELSREVRLRPLSADFDARLWQRVTAERPPLNEAARRARKRRMETEYAAFQRRLRAQWAPWRVVLKSARFGLASGAPGLAVGWALWVLAGLAPIQGGGAFERSVLLSCAAGVVCLAAGAIVFMRVRARLRV